MSHRREAGVRGSGRRSSRQAGGTGGDWGAQSSELRAEDTGLTDKPGWTGVEARVRQEGSSVVRGTEKAGSRGRAGRQSPTAPGPEGRGRRGSEPHLLAGTQGPSSKGTRGSLAGAVWTLE